MLQWRNLSIPFIGGINQGVEGILLSPPNAAEIRNCIPEKLGRLKQRCAFREFPHAISSRANDDPADLGNSTIKSIVSTGRELVAIGPKKLFTAGQEITVNGVSGVAWTSAGYVPPASVEHKTISGLEGNSGVAETLRKGNCIISVWTHTKEGLNGARWPSRAMVKVEDVDGNVLIPPTSMGDHTHSPKLINLDTGIGSGSAQYDDSVCIAWVEQEPDPAVVTSGDLKFRLWREGAISLGTVGTASTNVKVYAMAASDPFRRLFDACHIPHASNPIVGFAFVTGGTLDLAFIAHRVDNDTNVWNGTIGTRADYNYVACAHNRLTGASGVMAVAAVANIATEVVDVNWLNSSDGTLAATEDAGVLVSDAGGEEFFSIGIEYGSAFSQTQYVLAASFYRPTVAPGSHITRYKFIDTPTGTWTATALQIFNSQLIVQPFFYNDRCYAGFVSNFSYLGFNSCFVMDLNARKPTVASRVEPSPPFAVACWDVGAGSDDSLSAASVGKSPSQASFGIPNARIGTAGKAFVLSSEVYFSVTSISFASFDGCTVEADRIKLDFSAKIKGVKVADGALVIPGSIVAWYDSERVAELGWLTPARLGDAQNQAGTIAAGTYFIQGIWHFVDGLGFVHRSPPGNILEIVAAGGNDQYYLRYMTNPITMNTEVSGFPYGTASTNISYLSDATDSKFRELSPRHAVTGNPFTTDLTTYGWLWATVPAAAVRGPTVYTQDGADLPAQAPGACTLATLVKDRLWLGGFARKDRVQYSDKLAPFDSTAERYAPEFFNLQSYQIPSANQVTGIASRKDSTIVFTEKTTYVIAGDGPDFAGRNNDFSGLIKVSDDYGCINKESVVEFPGGVFFQSAQGLCLIGGEGSPVYVPSVKDEFISYTCVSSCHWAEKRMVLFLMDKGNNTIRFVVYNYDFDMWHIWEWVASETDSIGNANRPKDMCIHDGVLYVALTGSIYKYTEGTYDDNSDGSEFNSYVETPWIHVDTLSGQQKLRNILPHLFIDSSSSVDMPQITVRIYKDYNSTQVTSMVVNESDIASYDLPTRIDPKIHYPMRCKAFKVRIEGARGGVAQNPITPLSFVSVDFEYAVRGKTHKPKAAQRE